MAAAAVESGNVRWCKTMASLLENTARTLRLFCGPSGKAHRIPIGLQYMEPTPPQAMVAAYRYAAAHPEAGAENITEGSAATVYGAAGKMTVVKANIYDAKQALRWATGIRNAAKLTGFPGTECKATKRFGAKKKDAKGNTIPPTEFVVIL
jgi:hypothetical protein